MNYRHAFHAGNFADVAKHLGLICVLERLAAKAKPFSYFETHAGRGRYNIDGTEARRSGEAEQGIRRLATGPNASGVIGRYLDLVRSFQPAPGTLSIYPGSPLIARSLLREGDRAQLCELQPEELRMLRQNMGDDRRFGIHQRDGYEALGALLPPTPRRGMVLIDPPYEKEDELQRLVPALEAATRKWPTGIFMVWYPIKHRRDLRAFYRQLSSGGFGSVLLAELTIRPDDSRARLNGSGLAFIRPPWQLDRLLASTWAELARRLGDEGAKIDVRWLSRSTPAAAKPDESGPRSGRPSRAPASRPVRSRR